MRLVLIEWFDSMGATSAWDCLEHVYPHTKPALCRSVGWLAQDGAECKVLIPHIVEEHDLNDSQQGCGTMIIPTCAVRSMKTLVPA